MSIEAVNAVMHHSKATGTDKLILIGIAWHIGPDPEDGCWPRISKLAKYANTTERSVQRSLTKLIEMGEIERVLNGGLARTGKKPNCFYLLVNCPPGCSSFPQHKH
jgi:hypothetical protein